MKAFRWGYAVFGMPFLKFTLTYDGPLLASGNKGKSENKWEIRKRRTPPAGTPGRRDSLARSAQAATATLDCWFAFQFQGSRSTTLLAG